MHATTTTCDDTCGCDESAFARVRYSYGQRLTAVDLLDEQAYLIGKDRFVARHVLGAGVLCGLRAQRGDGPPERTPTVRVTRGAALDLCGREIVVEHDQCLDVAAWYARRREQLTWEGPGTFPAWIGLRYRECPSDPVRVPGDPCGCDGGGCAYTRVHESFELALHAAGGPVEPASAPGAWSSLCRDLADSPAAAPLGPTACPPCACEGWLLVAGVDVLLAEPGAGAGLRAVDIGAPDNADTRRMTLHSLAALQRVVSELGAGAADCGPAPRIAGVAGDGDLSEDADKLTVGRAELRVALGPGADGKPVALASGTIATDRISLLQVGDSGWEAVSAKVKYDAVKAAFLVTTKAAELDRPYRLVLEDDAIKPIADELLRPLRPARWSRGLRWVLQPAAPGSQDPPTARLQTNP